jgi:hypothetical protein
MSKRASRKKKLDDKVRRTHEFHFYLGQATEREVSAFWGILIDAVDLANLRVCGGSKSLKRKMAL